MGNVDSMNKQHLGNSMKLHHKVQLAATPLVPFAPSAVHAYHTSIAVDDVEFCFSRRGITLARSFESHSRLSQGPPQIFNVGTSPVSIPELMTALEPFFKENEYDLLRKNCNTFSDCALFFLMGSRLDSQYRELEQIGTSVEKIMGPVGLLSLGDYKPNPMADGVDAEQVVRTLTYKKDRANSVKQCKLGMLVKAKDKIKMKYTRGMQVEVLSRMHKSWVVATVMAVDETGTVTVLYENGVHQKDVPAEELSRVLRPRK